MNTLLSYGLLPLSLIGAQRGTDVNQPNIIIILADDLGYNDLSCYRNTNPQQGDSLPTCQTPNLDALAAQGIRFTDFYCGAPVSSPSRSALLTGRNSSRLGIYNWIPANNPMHLRADEITIAEMLKPIGYRAAHFGKWHLSSENMDQPSPTGQGFDYEFFTYNNAEPSHENPVNFIRNGKPVGEMKGYACQLVVDEAIKWLDSSQDSHKPFYINVWFQEPHKKEAAPPEITSRHNYNKDYYGAVENMDLAVGRLINYLKKNKLDKNTIVLFSSDNGSIYKHSNDPLRGRKSFTYDGGVRVPFIACWKGQIKPAVSGFTGSFTDILPTIGAITHCSLPTDRIFDGMDISSLLLGNNVGLRRDKPVFFFRYFHNPVCMLREGDMVLLGYEEPMPYLEDYSETKFANLKPEPDKPIWSMWSFRPLHMEYAKNAVPKHFELYNIKEDPGQKSDLASQYPDVVEQMKEKMLQLRSEMLEEGGDWYHTSN